MINARKEAGFESGKTFKVLFIPYDEVQSLPERKVYSNDVERMYAEAMKSLDEDVMNGLTREQSFERLEETMKKIGGQIKQNESSD